MFQSCILWKWHLHVLQIELIVTQFFNEFKKIKNKFTFQYTRQI